MRAIKPRNGLQIQRAQQQKLKKKVFYFFIIYEFLSIARRDTKRSNKRDNAYASHMYLFMYECMLCKERSIKTVTGILRNNLH